LRQLLQQQKKLTRAVLIPLALLIGGAVVACSETEKAPVRPSTTASKSIQQPVTLATPTATEAAAPPVYSYDAHGRRDPFAPLVTKAENRERAGSRPPLERYSVSEFHLTGIVWGGFGYNAMLEGPDGKGYFVRVGTIIGPNKGVIKKITKDSMVIEEKYKNFMGATERKQVVILLRTKQEGMQ
jgi:type IV pilus assembly protein PilP